MGCRCQPAAAHLQSVLPAPAELFAAIDSEITLAFLGRFTTQEQADWLSPAGWPPG